MSILATKRTLMSFSEDKFRDHIRTISRQTTYDSDRPLTLDELRQLAESMGVTDREWNELLLKAETSLNQALAHLKVENYTDAILSAEEATSINPYIKDGNAILSQSYYKLAIVDKDDELFAKAEHYARMELKNDPLDSIALNVISSIESIKGEGKYSKKLIRTIAYVAGGAILIFLVLFMCNQGVKDDRTREIAQEVIIGTADDRMQSLKSTVESLEKSYISAIERRNQDALELVGYIDDEKLKNAFKEVVMEYDFDKINTSEQEYRLVLSDVKSNFNISSDLEVRLEGGDNRINTAKKRYLEAVSNYNSTLNDLEDELEKNFDQIEERK